MAEKNETETFELRVFFVSAEAIEKQARRFKEFTKDEKMRDRFEQISAHAHSILELLKGIPPQSEYRRISDAGDFL